LHSPLNHHNDPEGENFFQNTKKNGFPFILEIRFCYFYRYLYLKMPLDMPSLSSGIIFQILKTYAFLSTNNRMGKKLSKFNDPTNR